MNNEQKKIKIILVDDDELIRIYFRDIFWIHGLDDKYELKTIDDVKKAEEVIFSPTEMPDIVFLDLVMPIEKEGHTIATPEAGLNLLKKIKGNPQTKNIKVVIFSGHDEKIIQDQVKELGVENYLVKGSSLPKELVDFVENISK